MNIGIISSNEDINPDNPIVNDAASERDEFLNIDSNEIRSLLDSEANMSTKMKTMSDVERF